MLLQDISRADPSRRHLVRSGGVSFGNLNADHRRSHALHRFGEAVKQIQARQREGKVITAACIGSLSAKLTSLDTGMLAITDVPDPFDSIVISPPN